ncbi:MAG TPA: hypothetical protein VFB66_01085 [Tepidisphaeraceae bacterium]|nr:hypothetical protein [Tepidisphaeraceae bacterium]
MRCFGFNFAPLASRLPEAEGALRWAAVWSAPWAVLASVWLAHVVVPYVSLDEEGQPHLTYMTPDGRLHPGAPPGAASGMVSPVAEEEEVSVVEAS